MNSAQIYQKANGLVRKYHTRNPLEIINYLGIDVYYNEFDKLLGMYTYLLKHRIIILNNQIDGPLCKMVAGHELGHDQLHREIAKSSGFQEFSLDCGLGTLEYEANAFCSHVLISNEDLLELIHAGKTIKEMSAILCVDANLIVIKANELKKMGYLIGNTDDYNSKFLINKKPLD